jgi:microcystin-dependent protein
MLAAGTNSAYDNTDPPRSLAGDTVTPFGGSQPHSNLQPYLCLNFIISLYGIYPSQT